MRRSKQLRPEVNAGSMADIAFLLLIFFLVTAVIPDNQGFNRKLPKPCPPGEVCDAIIQERNLFQIIINEKNEIMVNETVISIEEIKELAMIFIDNNGDNSCDYCNGKKLATLSDRPNKAIISLISHPNSTYANFIAVQDELTKAYYELRKEYALNVLKTTESSLTKDQIDLLKEVYPFIFSEATTH